ncbi:endonuclease/exonuclease/phosphatase family protein [Chitinophaga qingshengii]|uniref:Endonuclease/exonuclease/phosphatase family protein n=1 Tax=Chitinophaga qingshengii TaxID=1569794 RepID=A0ABR7TJ31_9BACT|nr:endonuclease/exonuclease/phosphatase family protein [Chitinophaga qingshengii]MBC9930512.1 endonuclease/exonuclease/phosphatase family protein [Chitinophaga qingshengii]
MRKYLITGLLLTLFACSKSDKKNDEGPTLPVKEKVRLKVMTYNIYGARASSGPPADLTLLAKVINEQQPDLVALQEVDVFTNRTGTTVHQAKELAALTGMEWFYTKAIDVSGGQFGDAVLSRLPIKESKRYGLPVDPAVSGEFRSVAMIKVNKEGKDFYFASTHLDHLAQENNRLVQAAELKKIVTGLDLPLIMAGDLNAVPASQTMDLIRSFMNLGCVQQCPLTFPSDKPDRTIDYIMTTPNSGFSVNSHQPLTGYIADKKVYASDHCSVVATISIN